MHLKVEFEKRLFIGIPANQEIQSLLAHFKSTIKYNPSQIQWVSPNNIHLTLLFLGNVIIDNIPTLTNTINGILDLKHFKVSIEKTGIFHPRQSKKIFWLGVGYGKQKIVDLHKHVKNSTTQFNVGRKEEQFIPHITIGRTPQSCRNIDFLPFLKYVYSPIELYVNSFVLYESKLLPHGPDYKVLTKSPLN